MVSKPPMPAVMSVTILFFAVLSTGAQTTPVSSGFREASTTGSQTQAASHPLVSPELRGDILMARKMYREAAEAYKEGPQNAILLNKTGIAYHQMLDFTDARKYYQQSLRVDPHYAEAINNLGTIEYSRRGYRRAIGLYKKALRFSPNSASIYSNLGTGYFARKNYKEATEAFQKALSLDPEVFEHRSTHGVLLQERSVEERAKFHFYLSKMYAKSGATERALLYMRKSLEEGFKDRKKFLEEPEFAALKETREFKEIMALETRVL